MGRYCAENAPPAPATVEEGRVSRLLTLTPRVTLPPAPAAPGPSGDLCKCLEAALEAECELKIGPQRAIGFY